MDHVSRSNYESHSNSTRAIKVCYLRYIFCIKKNGRNVKSERKVDRNMERVNGAGGQQFQKNNQLKSIRSFKSTANRQHLQSHLAFNLSCII